MEGEKSNGPYKATKLWKEMVETFRNGIPLKRHRRHIKVYDNCFTGQEAVHWFQTVLQNSTHTGSNVTKDQTVQLLNKFLKAGVFQNVSASSDGHHQYIKEGDLYQLTDIRSPRPPLAVKSQNIQQKLRPQPWFVKPPILSSQNTVGLPPTPQHPSLPLNNPATITNPTHTQSASALDNYYKDIPQNENMHINKNHGHLPKNCTSDSYNSYNSEGRTLSEQYNYGFTDSPQEPKPESSGRELGDLYTERDPYKWLEPVTLDSVDTFEVERNFDYQRETLGQEKKIGYMKDREYRHNLDSYSTLPQTQSLRRSSSVVQSKFNGNEFLSSRQADQSRQLPKLSGAERIIYNRKMNGPHPNHYRSASESRDAMHKNTLHRTGSVGLPKSSATSGVNEFHQIWKQVIIKRLAKLVPELEMSFKFELEEIPGEWIAANTSAKLDYQHDFHFPQSLVAAMNCLVHWPQTVPNEILKAFKNHYFQLKEPLTTFKLHSLLCKVYLYITTTLGVIANDGGLYMMKLPPNSCFETAFTSDSPVTRIVPQRSVDTLHYSHDGQFARTVQPTRIIYPPNIREKTGINQTSHKNSNFPGVKQKSVGKSVKMKNRRAFRRVRSGIEEDKMHHVRNKSGGYVNPALSQSIDEDFTNLSGCPQVDMDQELDYVAALESLKTLMRCSRRDTSFPVVGGHESDSRSSESSSYYTAVSSSSSSASSRRSSLDLVDSVHTSMEETKENAMVCVMQLLLLCIPVYHRTQLRYLLHFMNQWNLHHSLCAQADVIDIFTPTILRSNLESEMDVRLMYSVVHFLVTHHDHVMTVPADLETEVFQQLSIHKMTRGNSMTFCEQVSNRQFEEQKLTGSQLALSELLEQILQDRKMNAKEKRKRLKMFKESYPHIYHRRFPDNKSQESLGKKQSSGLLNLATLNRLKSLRM